MNSIKRLREASGPLVDQQNCGKVNVKVRGRGAVVASALHFLARVGLYLCNRHGGLLQIRHWD